MKTEHIFHKAFCFWVGNILSAGEQPGNDPEDIPVHGRFRQTESNGCNRAGSVIPDSGKLPEFSCRGRKASAVLVHQQDGGFFQVSGTAVVTQTFPKLQQPVIGDNGETLNVGKLFQKTDIIGNHRFDTGLLKHDFSNPGMVRRRILPPRQNPTYNRVPPKDPGNRFRQNLQFFRGITQFNNTSRFLAFC